MKDERAQGTRKRLLHREGGASAVEFALTAPLLFMIVFRDPLLRRRLS